MGKVVPKDIIQKHIDNVIYRVWNWWSRAKTRDEELFNAALGLAGEAGEVCDTIKKMYFHEPREGREEALMLELHDVYFYAAKIQDHFGWTTAEVLGAGKDKLFERFNINE